MSLEPDRVKSIFTNAVENHPPDRWAVYLDSACAGDVELRREVDRLLKAHLQSDDLLERGPLGGETTAFHESLPPLGDSVDKYRLLEVIGEGGYGVVYLADQQSPVRRRVALKLIKPGMDSRQVLLRFDAERQALAMMDHPNIAKVFDGGVTVQGRPYFVMEYVKGIPVTEYCDQACLSVDDRLGLFAQVCLAVQHAHQKGIVHRDIKPSNVLVCLYDGKAVPKVIDFGLAKALHQSLTENTLFTAHGQIVGTPLYMSPEQAEFNNLDVDTRTDVYSLGVLLYELLTGSPPLESHRVQQAAWQEVLRLIKEEDAPPPSSRLSSSGALPSIAARRNAEPEQLSREIKGDLDWIVMKALEKDRSRRYESPSALAADLARHLANQPVEAAAPSRLYHLKKFCRRNRRTVVASFAFLAALCAGLGGTIIGFVGEARQRREAEAQAAIASAVSQFQSEMLASADPNHMLGDKVTVLQAIQAAVKELDAGKLQETPRVEARVREVVGLTLRSLGHYDEAEPNLQRALLLHEQVAPGAEAERADHLFALGAAARGQGNYVHAEDVYRDSLAIRRRLLPDADPRIWENLSSLAEVCRLQGKQFEAEALATEGVTLARRGAPVNAQSLADSLHTLGMVIHTGGQPSRAEPHYQEALEISRAALPEGSPQVALYLGDLAAALSDQGKLAQAEPLYREAIADYRQNVSADHPEYGKMLSNLALLLDRRGSSEEAERTARAALKIYRTALRSDDPELAACLNNLGMILCRQGRAAEGVPLLRESLEIVRKIPPPGFPFMANVLNNLGEVLLQTNELRDAELMFREALAVLNQKSEEERWKVGITRCGLGRTLVLRKEFIESETELLAAEAILAQEGIMAQGYQQKCVLALVELYDSWDAAEPEKEYKTKAETWRDKLKSRESESVSDETSREGSSN